MANKHPHAAAIDRIGFKAIQDHFRISRQAVHYWKVNGVPDRHKQTLAMLGSIGGHDTTELRDDVR